MVVAHSATTVSDRLVDEMNGFNLIIGDAKALRIQDWRWAAPAFRKLTEASFVQTGVGWERTA